MATRNIPIAQFGTSNVGRMKTVYRNGLGVRYGRMMQAISGVHFNYSFPEQDVGFVGGYRAVARARPAVHLRSLLPPAAQLPPHGWIVLYLFGVSPVVCNSFLRGRNVTLPRLSKDTSYEPYATSLRMSDLGYRIRNQAGLSVSVNSLDEYVRDLSRADQHAARAVREDRREGRRRVSPAERQHPADRERVLQFHPAEARRAFGRASDQGTATRGRRIRRGACARRERVRSRWA
jgi:gamma-glutamylcysteine synthetase